MPSGEIRAINDFLQGQLAERGRGEVRAVEAARWLDDAGLLGDSESRPGLPLRNVLRDGAIIGAEQRPPKNTDGGSLHASVVRGELNRRVSLQTAPRAHRRGVRNQP